jgi:hypothetical protein
MTMSRYAYDYSLSPARPTGWRGTLTSMTVVGTVMAVSAISGALVTLQLFASPAQDAAVPRRVAAAFSVASVPQPVAPQIVALAAKVASVPAVAATNHVAPPVTTAAAPTAQRASPPPPAGAVLQPAPVAAQPAPIADSELTFAKGYVQRQAVANGTATVRHGKVLVAAQTQLGRAATKAKPRTYAARNNASNPDRRRIETARGDAYGMLQRFERPDQFDFARHQALAFGEQRSARRHTPAPRQPYGNSPNGLFGGLF